MKFILQQAAGILRDVLAGEIDRDRISATLAVIDNYLRLLTAEKDACEGND